MVHGAPPLGIFGYRDQVQQQWAASWAIEAFRDDRVLVETRPEEGRCSLQEQLASHNMDSPVEYHSGEYEGLTRVFGAFPRMHFQVKMDLAWNCPGFPGRILGHVAAPTCAYPLHVLFLGVFVLVIFLHRSHS